MNKEQSDKSFPLSSVNILPVLTLVIVNEYRRMISNRNDYSTYSQVQ